MIPENTILSPRSTSVVNWCRKYSLWPMPFATACCGIELMAVGASRFDIARFGAEVMRFSPRQCDLMIVAGRVAMKMMPVLQRIWLQMPEPKWCISMGACASTGGVFDTYAVVQGVDRFIPVDVYIPGCPPRPEQILRALMDLQAKIQKGGSLFGTGLPEMVEREKLLEEKRNAPVGQANGQERGDEDRFGYRLPGGPSRLGARGNPIELRAHWPSGPEPPPECIDFMTNGRLMSIVNSEPPRLDPGDTLRGVRRRRFHHVAVSRQSSAVRTAGAAGRAALGSQEQCGFDLLAELGATDYLGYPGRTRCRFEVHYVLRNLDTTERLIVKVGVDDPDPSLPSAVPSGRVPTGWSARCSICSASRSRPSRPAAHPDARGVHRLSAAQGLSAAGTRRTA